MAAVPVAVARQGSSAAAAPRRPPATASQNQAGITDDTIKVANVSDISGPVPGIFESAQQGSRAFAAYFNSTSTICGRKLEIQPLDSRADGSADQQQFTRACDEAFAAVGSMSAFDSGGAATAEKCGIPDMRALSVTPERLHCATCFSAYALSPNLVPNVMPQYFVKKFPEATQHVAILYVNIGAAAVNAQSFKSGWSSNGWKVDYFEGIDTAEFNYAPYVQQMRDKGIRFVVYLGPYQFTVRLQQAMTQQNFDPDVFLQDPTIYDQRYVDEAGSDGDGSYVYSTVELFDNLKVPEMALYRSWLQQIKPGAIPNYYGLYAWSATRLFVEQALALGGDLTRASLIARLKQVKDWTSNGLHTGQPVGSKATGNCIKIIQLNKGRWSQVSPGDYICGGMTNTGIGG